MNALAHPDPPPPAVPAYALLTDAPPLKEGGHGCCVLAWNWLQAVNEQVKLVITHRLLPEIAPEQVRADVAAPVSFYPDSCRLRVMRRNRLVHFAIDAILFRSSLPRLAAAVRASGAQRLFALFGGEPRFLLVARGLARRSTA